MKRHASDALRFDPRARAAEWLEAHDRVVLATVVSTWGSSPVPVGGQLVVGPDDQFEGSVAGGCVEAEVIAKADDVLASGEPSLLEFDVSDETAWQSGLPCGGRVEIFLQRLHGDNDRRYLQRVLEARAARATLLALTDLANGRQKLHDLRDAPEHLRLQISSGVSGVIATEEGRAFLHILEPPVRLLIVGATHVGQVLSRLAQAVSYEVIVIDPRSAFASDARFSGAPIAAAWPDEVIPELGLDNRTAVVVLSHVADIDDGALVAALRSDCPYVGALGSRRTHAKRLDRLRSAGLSDQDLNRIHAPVGLPIGAKGPAEIAVSILAEIIATEWRAE